MAELIPVNIIIADRSYRLKIDATDEEIVRRTIKTLNEKIVEFKTNFAGKDMQDYVAMVLLWYATEQQKPVSTEIATLQDKERLQKLENIIDKTLLQQ
jgi:cell division protein ZapA